MAFPYVADINFEGGGIAEWDSETDTGARLTIDHWTTLARHGARLELPFQGAYAMRVALAPSVNDAYLQEDNLFDLAATAVLFIRFYLYASGLVMAASDRFTIFALESAAGTNEVALSIVNNAGEIQLVASETGATALGAGTRQAFLAQDLWHCVELRVAIDAGAGNDGTIDFYLDGYQVGAQITGLDQGAIIHARMGVLAQDAGTTAGHLLFDSVVADDTRIFPVRQRFGAQRMATKTSHLFVGQGQLQQVTLMAGAATDNSLLLFDTDEANSNDVTNLIVPELRNAQGASDSVVYHVPSGQGYFQRGCYAVLAGTNPRAIVQARQACSGVPALRSFAEHRRSSGIV